MSPLPRRADGLGALVPAGRRRLAYLWAAPNTAVGLLAALSSHGRPRRWRGVLLVEEGRSGWARALGRFGFNAVTLGHVILADRRLDDHTLAHELAHVRQHERLGPLFYPAYLLAQLAGYRRNPFERAAERAATAVDRARAGRRD